MSRKRNFKKHGTVFIIGCILIFVVFISLIFNILNVEGYQNTINSGAIESTIVTVSNLFSIDGLRFMVGGLTSSFANFSPLILMIIALFGIGVCERSGLLYSLFNPFKNIKMSIIVFLTLLISIVSSIFGVSSYIFLIPIIGVIYKVMGKNPMVGIITTFIGISIGYGSGVMFNYDDHLLGLLTETSASLEVDKTYSFNLFSYYYIMLTSTFAVSIFGSFIINKFLVNKLDLKVEVEEEVIDKKAKRVAIIIMFLMSLITVYMILPINLFGAGVLLGDNVRYIERLFGPESPFGSGFVFIISLILVVSGYVYGKISGNIKNGQEFSLSLSKSFEKLGLLFVLMFVIAEFQAILDWTNLGVVINSKLIDLLSGSNMSSIFLILVFIIIVIVVGFFIPGSLAKWKLMSPTIVPLFMQSNITPGFTQFIFKVANGIGNSLNPMFCYFIIMIAFLQKYKTDDRKITLFRTYKLMLPSLIMISLFWITFITIWYLVGIPIGVGIGTNI